ncbi:RNA polymerase recycling motor ATPase HelR [Agreia bicolorata]|uniref:ATPase AAA n=1 Tax=Agreia bicolorata TaxID=110935 RepID=A0ABR5CBS4_9MICO|nr:RNA polymerase recycling motor ATPase HelR [Agreia bicolorata]KJC63076.1 ATPase AAA [Agreia bicolorata]
MTVSAHVFALPAALAAKADAALIADDERHFEAIERSLAQSKTEVSASLDKAKLAPAGAGQGALDRDFEVHRLSARLRALSRFGLDLCLGRMVPGEGDPVYVGRFGLTDSDGRRLVLDWRSPAAEPFFGATHAHPMGLRSRRRYRWTLGRITDYWDELFVTDELAERETRAGRAALDDQSAFIASLGSSRSPRMRDVLGTIQADQDAIIRAGSRGALVVDGGPGTGKTVVALHRTAYLLYSDPRLAGQHGGVLFVGPSPAYLAYVSDVLPSLGEESVQTCSLRELVAEGERAVVETDPAVAELKASIDVTRVIEAAVRSYERPPSTGLAIETDWADLWVDPADWADAFDAADPGAAHNEARDQVWDALLDILLDQLRDADEVQEATDEFDAYGFDSRGSGSSGVETSDAGLRRALASDRELALAFSRAWPLVEASELVRLLWSSPQFLRRCAPELTDEQVELLQRESSDEWTTADLPLLDLARRRLGDPEESRLRRRSEAAAAAERARMSEVIDDLIANDDSDMKVMSMLRGQDLRRALVDDSALPQRDLDQLAGPFAHVVVDEAQELTDAEWQMLLARCPSRSFTIVGDRAQARQGFSESWEERLPRVGLGTVTVASLTINYRTPVEVMTEAAPVIRAALPDANVPTSVRSTGVPVLHAEASRLDSILDEWLAQHEGIACVIAAPQPSAPSAGERSIDDGAFARSARDRVSVLTPELSKGLEFDLVVLVDPDAFGDGIRGAVDRYVAMTRATQQLVIVTS